LQAVDCNLRRRTLRLRQSLWFWWNWSENMTFLWEPLRDLHYL